MEEEERHGPAELRRRYTNMGDKDEHNVSESDEEVQKAKDVREIVR